MKLIHFKDIDFLPAIKALFKELKVPMNYVADEPTTAKEILKDTYKDNTTFQLADDVYFVGMVDDAAFEGNNSLAVNQIKSDYDGVLVFGITLHQRPNNLLPTRSQLAEISRAFNREFYYTPVVLVFKYKDDQADYIAFANTERLQYKQAWREGEKPGKVSLLRDINIAKPHRGHEDIIDQLRIPTTGTKAIDTFAKLYTYWQEVFSVSVLNKKFYQELSNWYFWAVKHVTFPNKPTIEMVVEKYGKADQPKLDDLIQEHNATNVIRLLTRLLFTWFIKEKKLIPEDLFDLDALQKDILNDISPYHEEGTMFAQANKESIYYKAILQNLFFASLNCPIEADGIDNRTRGFRSLETADGKFAYGKHFGIDYLMRYKDYFKDPDAFLALMNKSVPFLNGGLFECLDDKSNKLYIDGFSDGLAKGEQLIVPDYLFFGVEEHVDLSAEYGVSNKGSKEAAVKGLINILKSYKFTITENTPIEEDVALDPELLGKVFENLLASYNPETKTTARKQTGSFYTPREIVNYMVDESLIAYLKNTVTDWGMDEKELDEKLHQLTSFDPVNPFSENLPLTKRIVKALDECKILDPACGSGAFPMGILQKMVHILQKLDADNAIWKDVQLHKAMDETEEAFGIENKKEREEKLIEINNAFDERVNDPDYARKLYLIENCVYGVDIQPIATQIAKLRFFISLVVDQKVVKGRNKLWYRPLPNLETKFVTANTLVGIKKDDSLFYTDEVKNLEKELKQVRHKIFGLRSKKAKLDWREKDKQLRTRMSEVLIEQGLPLNEASKLAAWDPYDQNDSASFFDPEWMFDITEGFDVVIGNPPYILVQNIPGLDLSIKKKYLDYKSAQYKVDLYHLFIEKGVELLSDNGAISYITPNTFIKNKHNNLLRELIYKSSHLELIVLFYSQVFESVSVDNLIFVFTNTIEKSETRIYEIRKSIQEISSSPRLHDENSIQPPEYVFNFDQTEENSLVLNKIESNSLPLKHFGRAYFGIQTFDRKTFVAETKQDNSWKPVIDGGNVFRYRLTSNTDFVNFIPSSIKSGGNPDVYKRNRIVVRQIGKYPEGAVCPPGLFTLNTIYNIFITNNEVSLYFLLAQINSPVIRYHWLANNYDNKATFPKIKKAPLESIPIKISNRHQRVIDSLIEIIIKINQNIESNLFADVVDALILDLHFSNHMKEREVDVLQFVERDMEKALQGRELDSLSDSEKEKVIEQLHATWSHPDNEVRNRIKLFAVRSPEILKPILES
jgi:adenine-specific DNA-methyltransferase